MALASCEGRFSEVNRAFCQIVGYTAAELREISAEAITHPEDRSVEQKLLAQLTKGDIPFYHVEKRLVPKRGDPVWVLQSVTLLPEQCSGPRQLLCQVQDITDRKRAEQILLEGEALFRAVLESAPDGMLLIDRVGKIVLVNARVEDMFGYRRDQLIGQTVDLLLPEPLSKDKASAHGEAPRHGRLADGNLVPVEVSFSPLDLPERPLTIGIIRDVRDRHTAAAQLAQRAEQEAAIAVFGRSAVAQYGIRPLMDEAVAIVARTLSMPLAAVFEMPDGVLTLASSHVAPEVPAAIRAKIEKTPAALASLARSALAADRPVVYAGGSDERFDTGAIQSLRVTSAVASAMRLYERPYGCLVAYSLSPRQFSTEDLHFIEAVANLLSVAIERRTAEEAVRRDRDFAESLIGTAQAIVLVLDTQGHIRRFNPFTEELTGYRLADVKGTDWRASLLPERSRAEGAHMFEAALGGARFISSVLAIASRSGVEYEIQWSGRALADEHGAVSGVLLIGHDITELRAAQKKLLESERLAAIGQMASGLAHESRNALQQIGACAEMLSIELADQPEAADLVVGIHDAEERLHRLFEDVRAYAVPLRLNRRPVGLETLWRRAWEQLAGTGAAKDRPRELVEKLDDSPLEVRADAAALEQAFSNVMQNALDASKGPVVVTISTTAAMLGGKPAVRVSIRDNGPGFPVERYDNVLDPFFTTKTQGTGLGMSIVARIIASHGGRLELGPPGGPGAEVAIIVPTAPDEM